jgi:4'-phosphopantetheinyl transferase
MSLFAMLSQWLLPSTDLIFLGNTVHVWRADLNVTPMLINTLTEFLHDEEQARAQRFKFTKDSLHFTAARGILRHILSRYLSTSPVDIVFNYGPHGKPYLATENNLFFNVSHAYGYALYAIAQGREVGVDIEHIREDIAGDDIAQRFFSARENEELKTFPVEQRTRAFFNCWTRKEAFIKALGKGLHFSLQDFDVSLNETPQILSIKNNTSAAKEWSLFALQPAPNYVGALVVKGAIESIQYYSWQI